MIKEGKKGPRMEKGTGADFHGVFWGGLPEEVTFG